MKARRIILLLILSVSLFSFLLESCRKSHYTAPFGTPIAFVTPPGFPPPVYNFQNNPLTEEGFQLGKKLFYDGRLSIDSHYPCASCHQPIAAFTTYEHDRSHGYNGSHTLRNAPGLFNLAWYPWFNQDGSALTLESLFEKHITNPKEMAETIPNVLTKLKEDTAYRRMFSAAFGNEDITASGVYKALSQFLVSLVSAGSKYDQVKQGTAMFTTQEQNGYTLFQSKCGSCHKEPLFTDFSFRNTGLELDPVLQDYGRMRVTGNRSDSLKFRVPALRNLDFTSYYGHDGRLSIFRMMIQHYRSGVIQSPTLDPLLANGIPLTNAEEDDIVAFLRTLNDSAFLTNPRFRQ